MATRVPDGRAYMTKQSDSCKGTTPKKGLPKGKYRDAAALATWVVQWAPEETSPELAAGQVWITAGRRSMMRPQGNSQGDTRKRQMSLSSGKRQCTSTMVCTR